MGNSWFSGCRKIWAIAGSLAVGRAGSLAVGTYEQ